jgi:ligand-binding SRPBCC domain-containing protein
VTIHLQRRTWVPAPIDVVFALASSVEPQQASMARHRARAIAGRTSGPLGLGDEVTWRAWHLGVPLTLTSVITDHDPPTRFTDEQRRGPFAHYRHEHRFERTADGTLLLDDLRCAAPLGVLGRVGERLLLERRVADLLDARNAHLARLMRHHGAARPGRGPATDRGPRS